MMKVVRWTPRTDIRRPARTLDEMVNELWRQGRYNDAPAALRPALDVIEAEDAIHLRMDLPGLTPDEVTIEIERDLLTISGEFKSDDETGRYHARERRTGAFKRALRLADTLDASQAAATFENGVLALTLPRLPEAQPRRIEVKAV